MTDIKLYAALTTLPADLRKEVEDLLDKLKKKTAQKSGERKRKFGAAKGFFKMGKDFDEPLEDFKEYM
jgi:ABC-type phosphate/phosphonate transport system substrate-binding protein